MDYKEIDVDKLSDDELIEIIRDRVKELYAPPEYVDNKICKNISE